MNTRITTGVLATLLGGITLLLPGLGQAGTIGYMDMCGNDQAAHAAAISAAGHTPVYVPVPDSEALATLDGLSVTNCDNGGFGTAYTDHLAAITAAVNGGMVLFVHDRTVTDAGSILPGGGGIQTARSFAGGADIDFPAGSPILTGPGGVLNNTSLDGGSSSTHGFVYQASLPAGGSVLATRPGLLDEEGEGGFEGCDAYGYTGTKLNWCRNVCEKGYTGATLDMWIHRWVNKYHEDPPCAGGPALPPQEMEGATVSYPYGEGLVVYSTIPLDYYLAGSGGNPPRDNFNNVYLPNVIGWALPAPILD